MNINFCEKVYDIDPSQVNVLVDNKKTQKIEPIVAFQFARLYYQQQIHAMLTSYLIKQVNDGISIEEAAKELEVNGELHPEAPEIPEEYTRDPKVRAFIEELFKDFPCRIGTGFCDGGNLYVQFSDEPKGKIEWDQY